MCSQPPRNDSEGYLDTCLRMVELLKTSPPERLGITGGEPTLLGDRFVRLLQEFFFSCRSRHTRWNCDWSSDVCSSDLSSSRACTANGTAPPPGNASPAPGTPRPGSSPARWPASSTRSAPASAPPARSPRSPPRPCARSEERRVGKECRPRWSASHQKLT